jgi:hypothetical protein
MNAHSGSGARHAARLSKLDGHVHRAPLYFAGLGVVQPRLAVQVGQVLSKLAGRWTATDPLETGRSGPDLSDFCAFPSKTGGEPVFPRNPIWTGLRHAVPLRQEADS